ncbi:hypothetical protein [Sporichthya sp.]|uniref:hypothetical protein n=1 Tax=Sporichthya sp. TaxID=65475 RepID=UPI0017D83E56|nr:hypothetical protein [Sporichthya sp.]MBA3743432.1 glycosyltransferase family 39 protein [Sporichthya sp.]
MVVLPVGAWLLLWLLVARQGAVLGFPGLNRRAALVIAFGAHQVLLVAITEAASMGHHLTRGTVALAWLGIVLVLVASVRRELPCLAATGVDRIGALRHADRRLDDVRIGSASVAAMVAVLMALAWLYRPNNGDSLVYHLARVEHWVQNNSVHTFATHYLAQVELSPLSGYNFAHLHLLTGGDRLDGYPQLLATVVCVLGASELGRRLGLGRRGQVLTALLVMTIPNLVLEATSTQNNNFAAAVGVTLMVVLTSPLDGRWTRRAVAVGLSGGLVILVKGTLVALLGPLGLALLGIALYRAGREVGTRTVVLRASFAAIVAVVAVLVLAGPFVARNYEMFDAPNGPVTDSTISTNLTARAAAANIVRSTAGEFASGDGLFPSSASRVIQDALEHVYNQTGVDPNDVNYLLGTVPNAFQRTYEVDSERAEAYGANPFHTVLIVAAFVAIIAAFARDRRRYTLPLALAVSLALGFFAFTATARWSVFAVRYYTPSVVLWCPLIVLAMRALPRHAVRLVAVVLVAAAMPQLLNNGARSLIHPRYHFDNALAPYFLSKHFSEKGEAMKRRQVQSFSLTTATIADSACRRVGIANWILIEYPLWVGLRDRHWPGLMNDVQVTNESKRYEVPDFKPCALIRQVDKTYVSADAGKVAYRFHILALSVDPAELGRAAPPRGFEGDGQIDVYPGSGWQLGDHGPTAFLDGAVLYLRATEDGIATVRIQLSEPLHGSLKAPAAERVAVSGLGVMLRVRVGPGITELRLNPSGDSEIKARVSAVAVRRD